MVSRRVALVCIILPVFWVCAAAEEVNVRNFICATLDWWPTNKCDYNQCPWGKAGLLNLDLKNKRLSNAMKEFGSLRIRIGGSLQDQVVYKVGSMKKCPSFKKQDGGMFGFSHGCLKMKRWDELNDLFNQTGTIVTFGLNALFGRRKSKDDSSLWVGNWNPSNARDLMQHTIAKGYKIDSYDYGNELCGSGVTARVEAEQYGKDMKTLKKLLKELYPDPLSQPKILGVVDGLSHHIYNLGAGVDNTLIDKVQDPYFLDQIAQTYKDVSDVVKEFAPWAGAWVGEAGGAYNSGGKDLHMYLDQLGMTSTFNHKVFCRQALVGGNYALLNTTTFIPNPDYYGALLWHRLMGTSVLRTSHDSSPYLRAYAHCSKTKPGITLLLINMSNSTSFEVSVVNDMNLHPEGVLSGEVDRREEYHLTPKDGNIQSDVLLLNGNPLQLTQSDDIPSMDPKLVDASTPIIVAPDSVVYATLREFNAPACA
ncbi:Beta-glucuronidase [Bertholletia excelsa]